MTVTEKGKSYPEPKEEQKAFDEAWAALRLAYKAIKEEDNISKKLPLLEKLKPLVDKAIIEGKEYDGPYRKWKASSSK